MNEELELPEEQDGDQELYEHYRVVADKGQEPLRIDKFLMNRVQNATRTKIQQAAENGNILVNEKPVKSNYKVKPHDVITVVFAHPPREIELIPQNIPIDIVYEDNDLIIVNKHPGMVVHPGYGNYKGTLVNALVYHFQQLPVSKSGAALETNKKSTEQAVLRPGLVHRLDKNTSGIMVVAKSEIAMTKLAQDFFDRNLDRKYIALVWGDFKEDSGTVVGNIGRHLKDRKLMDVFPEGSEYGKHAVTHYKVLERFGYVTLIECKLETGRTHQIRAHMQHIGHSLFNDDTYGGNRILKGTTFAKYKQFVDNCFELLPRHALHAKSLGFNHPTSGRYIHFDSELPEDMQAVIKKWRTYANSNGFEEEAIQEDHTKIKK
ncbi:MAG: RluA family pseudouridine synthase [Bacteroidetes bacterium]|nr:RluA family pseudouridine synthase [Bacteroidia bacterium]MBN8697810.1 RluA family pseudouridine synthase [Bacteroidota bacterium]